MGCPVITAQPPVILSSGDVTADRRLDIARQFAARGDIDAAIDLAVQALEVAPSWPAGWFELGTMWANAGQPHKARDAFANALRHDAEDRLGAALKLALLDGRTPEAMPNGYVTSLFDQYAPRFDTALVEALQYRAPQLMRDAVERVRPGSAGDEDILDLGCGTGLAAQAFQGRFRHIDGVDLSAGMIAEAANKAMYRSLWTGDIRNFLDGCVQRYDIVLAADVFVYVGALERIFTGTACLLRPGGLFCFSVQKSAGDGFTLGPDHRYSYGAGYVQGCAAAAGFGLRDRQNCILRQDEGRNVHGQVFVFSI